MRELLTEYGQTVLAAITGGLAIALACGAVRLLKPVVEILLVYLMK